MWNPSFFYNYINQNRRFSVQFWRGRRMRHQNQAARPVWFFVLKCRPVTQGRVKLCWLCVLVMPVCDVTGVCLTGDGGLPWAAAGGKAHFLGRDTAEGSESFPCKEMCFSGRQREECVCMGWYWENRIKLDLLTLEKVAVFLILKDEDIVYELSLSVSEGYPSRRWAIAYLNHQSHSLSSKSDSDWSFLERGIAPCLFTPLCSTASVYVI